MFVKRLHTLALLFILVIAPMFPVFMVPTSNFDSSESIGNIPEELKTVEDVNDAPRKDVELTMMFFTETHSSDKGFHYICRRGVDAVAFFGESTVSYISGGTIFEIRFIGCDTIVPEVYILTGSITNYFIGNDPSQWKDGVQDFSILKYANLYPGIDLVYKIVDGNLKYEFVVGAGADPEQIVIEYIGADSIEIGSDSVSIHKGGSIMKDIELQVFQGSSEVECSFSVSNMNQVSFDLGLFDQSRTLIIDPIFLSYSTYLGGSNSDSIEGVDFENGFVYVTGYTNSDSFPLVNANDSTLSGQDAFVTKFSLNGQSLIYSTFIGGNMEDLARGLIVSNGSAFIAGQTRSTDFPCQNAFQDTYGGSFSDAFYVRLSNTGSALIYSSYLGGSGDDIAYSVAIDDFERMYIAGSTVSPNFPLNNANDTVQSGDEGFVTRVTYEGNELSYSTYLGGATSDRLQDISVYASCAIVTGYTTSTDYPTVNAVDDTLNGCDAVVTRFSQDGGALTFSTYLGGTSTDQGRSISLEGNYAYVSCFTISVDYPLLSEYDYNNNGHSDIGLTKYDTVNHEMIYSTYIGGSENDYSFDSGVAQGYVYLTGQTRSSDFPTTLNAYSNTISGSNDCFITIVSPDCQSLMYSSYFGGPGGESSKAVAVENGIVCIAGSAYSTGFPTLNGYNETFGGGSDGFLSIFSPDTDSDSLTDWEELYLWGTDPYVVDTDNDNFLDSYEVAFGSDPLDPMSYPVMPQAWYDAIYGDLDGNSTLIQNLITWVDGNSSLLQTVIQQLDDNATLLTQVIAWLDGNHTAIETLFTQLDGNATLLMTTVNALNGNSTLIQNLLTWSAGNATLLQNVIDQVAAIEPTDLSQVIAWLDGNHTAIETLFTYVEGNATLLLNTIADVNYNEAQLGVLAALISGNTAFLNSLNATYFADFDDIQDALDEIRAVLEELGFTAGDSDYDGLDDLDELAYGTDLLCIDSDTDNLNDAFEVLIGTDPLSADTDLDNYLDGVEVIAGSDPLDPLSYPGSGDSTLITTIVLITGIGGVIVVIVIVFFLKKRKM